jgi:hypothetical protein
MAFKLTYSDGQETAYGDDTAWKVDDGVLKMGRKEGEWTVLVSPSHWAVIEVGGAAALNANDGEPSNDDESADGSDRADEEGGDGDADGNRNVDDNADKTDD